MWWSAWKGCKGGSIKPCRKSNQENRKVPLTSNVMKSRMSTRARIYGMHQRNRMLEILLRLAPDFVYRDMVEAGRVLHDATRPSCDTTCTMFYFVILWCKLCWTTQQAETWSIGHWLPRGLAHWFVFMYSTVFLWLISASKHKTKHSTVVYCTSTSVHIVHNNNTVEILKATKSFFIPSNAAVFLT